MPVTSSSFCRPCADGEVVEVNQRGPVVEGEAVVSWAAEGSWIGVGEVEPSVEEEAQRLALAFKANVVTAKGLDGANAGGTNVGDGFLCPRGLIVFGVFGVFWGDAQVSVLVVSGDDGLGVVPTSDHHDIPRRMMNPIAKDFELDVHILMLWPHVEGNGHIQGQGCPQPQRHVVGTIAEQLAVDGAKGTSPGVPGIA